MINVKSTACCFDLKHVLLIWILAVKGASAQCFNLFYFKIALHFAWCLLFTFIFSEGKFLRQKC